MTTLPAAGGWTRLKPMTSHAIHVWLALAVALASPGCVKKGDGKPSSEAADASKVVLTVKSTPPRRLHLTLRASYAERHRALGSATQLLVAFPRPRALGVSLRTARKPQDVVLLDDDRKVVRVAAQVPPGTARRVDVIPNLYRYALILPAGAAARSHLRRGTATTFRLPARAHPRKVLLPVTLQPPSGSAVTVYAELAKGSEETSMGLMYRRFLPARGGMLFRFPRPQILQFWMHNTRIPLDMIFINDNRVVTGVVQRAKPFDETNVGVGPVKNRYVLEVRAGFAHHHHIAAGTAVSFRLPE